MQSLEVSWAVRDIYIYIYDISRLRVNSAFKGLNNSKKHSSARKANSFSLITKFPSFYGIRRSITLLTTARHLTVSWDRSIQSRPTKLICLKIYFNIIIPSIPRSSESFLSFRFLHQIPLCTSPLHQTCNMPRVSPSWSDILNNIWRGLIIMNRLAVLFPAVLSYLVRLRSKYLLQQALF